jgi:hypothetical protein
VNRNQDMKAPKRIQRKRTLGWKMPEGAVYVGRPSKWGNPFRRGDCSAEVVVSCFLSYIEGNLDIIDSVKRELRGKDLACWCPLDQPCHADVLLEIANSQLREV